MKGYTANIEHLTRTNTNFRSVLYTAKHCQLVLMTLKPREEIGVEVHEKNDQFFRFESGSGNVIIDGVVHNVTSGTAVIIPKGAKHNVINTSDTNVLQLYTLYSPPHHKDKTVHTSKAQALASNEEFDGVTTE